jgi:hypothetical protein
MTSKSSSNGVVTFNSITIPDKYEAVVSKSHDMSFKEETITCDFKWETGFTCSATYFLITGFSVTGSVLSYNEPMPNVNVYLYAGTH